MVILVNRLFLNLRRITHVSQLDPSTNTRLGSIRFRSNEFLGNIGANVRDNSIMEEIWEAEDKVTENRGKKVIGL